MKHLAGKYGHGKYHTLEFLEAVLWLAEKGELGKPPGWVKQVADEAHERIVHYVGRYGDSRKKK